MMNKGDKLFSSISKYRAVSTVFADDMQKWETAIIYYFEDKPFKAYPIDRCYEYDDYNKQHNDWVDKMRNNIGDSDLDISKEVKCMQEEWEKSLTVDDMKAIILMKIRQGINKLFHVEHS